MDKHGFLPIITKRLIIRQFDKGDSHDLAVLMNDPYIASMMESIPHPFTENQATAWLLERPFDMDAGFVAKITLNDGVMVGFIGLGGHPVNTAYALGRKYWGKGYATEAMRAFLDKVDEKLGYDEITAGAYADNPASQRVLEKLGFEKIGQTTEKSSGRLEDAPLFEYRLRTVHAAIN